MGSCFPFFEGKTIETASCYKTDAKAGNAKMQYMLAMCYLDGNGVFKSVTKAKKWLELSMKKDI